MSLFDLEWELAATRKNWIVKRVFGTGLSGVAENHPVVFSPGIPGTVTINAVPWGTLNTHDVNKDRILGKLGVPATTRDIEIHRAICLLCIVGTGTTTAWVAVQRANTDIYTRDWRFDKDWIVVASNVSGIPASTTAITSMVSFAGTDIKVNGATPAWGTKLAYNADEDTLTGKVNDAGSTPITIIRRAGVFCKLVGSGGNSWIAVEGG